MRRKYIIIFLFVISRNLLFGQCVGPESFTVTPAGPYSSGQTVTVTYTLSSWTQLNVNWIIAFDIDYGPGWINPTPVITPNNVNTNSSLGTGYWIWDTQNTYPSGINFGPGFRFVNTAGYPNWGSSSTGPFTLSFQLTVGNPCTNNDLSIDLSVFGDCQTGGWNNGSCCPPSSLNMYSGTLPGPTSNSVTLIDCNSYTWAVNNQTYTSSGTYTDVSVNGDGCTHTEILNLTIGVNGCTDPLACNYDPSADCDDGTCVFDVSTPTVTNSCPGSSDGEISVSVNPIDPGTSYTYSINGSSPILYTNPTTGLAAGTYNYEFFVNGVSCGTQIITVNEFPPLSISLTTTDETCAGLLDGTASIDVQGSSNPGGTVSLLSYCASNPNTYFISQPQTIIEDVQLSGDNFNIQNNTAGSADFYEDYTASMYADVTQGQIYTIDITAGNMGFPSYDPQAINVYIDFNIDGDFLDAGEDLGVINIPFGSWIPGTVYSFNFTVPSTGVFGATRMRVVCMGNNGGAVTMGPCESPVGWNMPYFGATEDYSIVLNTTTTTTNASYLWSTGATTDSIYGLASGSYSVDITDMNGCVTTENFIIASGILPPTAYAGLSASICEGSSYVLVGATVSNNSGFNWTTNGTGVFIAANTLNPTYIPSPADVLAGSVVLTLTAMGNSPCSDIVSVMVLTIDPIPTTGVIFHN